MAMPSPISVTTDWAKTFSSVMTWARRLMIPSEPAIVRPPISTGQTGRDHAAEDEEQHDRDQRQRDDLGAFDVLVHAGGHGAGHRLQTGQFER